MAANWITASKPPTVTVRTGRVEQRIELRLWTIGCGSVNHRRNILDPVHKRVNIVRSQGIGTTRRCASNSKAITLSISGVAENISSGVLSSTGTASNVVRLGEESDLGVQIYQWISRPRSLPGGWSLEPIRYDNGRPDSQFAMAVDTAAIAGHPEYVFQDLQTLHQSVRSLRSRFAGSTFAVRYPTRLGVYAYNASQSRRVQSLNRPLDHRIRMVG